MATFRVGQRVRIVDCFCENAKHLIGVETAITDVGLIGSPFGSVIGYGVAAGRTCFERWGFTADQLEPLIDDDTRAIGRELLSKLGLAREVPV